MSHKPYIIAEAAQGYEGSLDISKLLVAGASAAGADAIKFQVIYANDIAERGYEHYELFRQLEMEETKWQEIRDYASSLKLDFIVDVFGFESLEMVKSIDVDAIKLHSTTFFDERLTASVLQMDKPTYISIGGIKTEELLELIARHKLQKRDNTVILFGFQSEPTPLEKNNLARIATLREEAGLDVGFMDHSEAGDVDDLLLSVLALGMGVRVFEKHITLDRELKLEDYVSGLTPSEFSRYVKTLRRLPAAFGSSKLTLSEEEIAYRGKALKRVVAARGMDAGTLLADKDIRLSRPAKLGGCYIPGEVLSRRLKCEVKEGDSIDMEMLES